MSSSQALPAPSNVPVATAPDESWISLASCARLLSAHPSTVKSMALAGTIRHRAIPGARVKYRRSDVDRLLAATQAR